MLDLPFRTTSAITTPVADVVRRAKHAVWGTNPVHLNQRDDDAILGFGTDAPVRTLSPSQIITFPAALEMVTAALHRVKGTYPDIPAKTLFLDIETHNAGREYDMPLHEFFRLGQYAWGWDGEIVLTTDLADVLARMEEADMIVAHNGHSFDFSVLLLDRALEFARDKRLLDTFVWANLVFPSPREYRNRQGHLYRNGDAPEGIQKWLGLDNLCFQLGVSGKIGDLYSIARKYQPEGTLKADCDYGLIPLEDPEFLAYAREDIVALRQVTRDLLNARPTNDYDWREQYKSAIDAQMTRNGVLVDRELAQQRVDEIEADKVEFLAYMAENYDFPTGGKMPWRSKDGKAAIFKILADNNITPFTRPGWTRTDTGNLSLGGDVLVEITEGTDAAEVGERLAYMGGLRSLAQQALDNCKADGRVHPSIMGLQKSGRRSVTKPGMTTWSARDESKRFEKAYFIASPGKKLLEFDLNAADQRIVAAFSKDKEYAKRFEEGVDGHEINGRLIWPDLYDNDPKHYRTLAKAPGHAVNYGGRPKRLAATTGLPLEDMERFVENFEKKYVQLTRWQAQVRKDGECGWITNAWGRRMAVGVRWNEQWSEWQSRSFTVSPALIGQSGTSEVLYDGLIALLEHDWRFAKWLLFPVHDALVLEVPDDEVVYVQSIVPEKINQTINGIDFPVGHGPAADTWEGAGHD